MWISKWGWDCQNVESYYGWLLVCYILKQFSMILSIKRNKFVMKGDKTNVNFCLYVLWKWPINLYQTALFQKREPGFFFKLQFILFYHNKYMYMYNLIRLYMHNLIRLEKTRQISVCHSPAFCWRWITFEHNECISSEVNVSLSYLASNMNFMQSLHIYACANR